MAGLGKQKTGGRQKGTPNKATSQVRAAAAKLCPEMLKVLAKIARSEKSEDKDRIDAATTILQYGAGKPTEMVEHSGPDGDPIPVSMDVTARIASITERLRNRVTPAR